MLPKIHSFPQQLIANLRVSEAKVSERCGISRLRTEALLVLIFLIALQPSKSFSEAAFAFGQWGNGGWAYGSAYNHRTQSEAQIAAMNTCNQRGYDCAIRGSFRKTCFAIAVQDSNSGFGTATHGDPDVANRQALVGCARMGLSCSIREEFCDNVSEAEIRASEQAEYQQYVQNWNVCFGKVATDNLNEQINYCDYALTFPRANQTDRSELLKQRGSLTATRDQRAAIDDQVQKQEQEQFHLYELRWQHCFDLSAPVSRLDGQIASCDYALTYSRATPDDRTKLIEQRAALIFSRAQLAQEERNERVQTTQQSFAAPVLARDESLVADPPASTQWDFSWLGFLGIAFFLQVLGIGSFVMLLGWSVLTERKRPEVFKGVEAPWPTIKEVRLTVMTSAGLLAAGTLLRFLLYRVPFEHKDFMLFASFRSEVFGNSLAALATGAWTSSKFFNLRL
jgi:Domain of unknown function (DUF4189)